jgi:CheY-like chemotaxis protein
MNRIVPFCATALALALAPSPGQACGESLLRVGQGLHYQVYQAKVPATVLVYAGATRPDVLAGLQQAGHRITVVRDAQALDQALRARRYDLVMVDAADAGRVAAQLQRLSIRADVVPVLARNEAAQRDRHADAIAANAGLGQYLKRINTIMKART